MKEGHGTMMSRSHFWNFEFSITAWFFGEEVTMYEWEGKMLSKQLMLAQHIRTNTTSSSMMVQGWWIEFCSCEVIFEPWLGPEYFF